MPLKTFIVTMEDAPDTKWLSGTNELAEIIQSCCSFLAISNSTGPQPKVVCSFELKKEDILAVRLIHKSPEPAKA